MAYTTAAKIKDAWADITDTEAGSTRMTNAITFADALIDASLNHRYTVPFSSTPTVIAEIATEFAVYIVKYRKDPRMVTDPQTEGERQVVLSASLLEQLKNGEISIPGETQKQLIESTTEEHTPIFNLDDELEHVIDADRLDYIEDERE